jgi:superfamily II DNA/RNA helicase
MAKLKLQSEVLESLEQLEYLPFNEAQRKIVSAIKSGQHHWLLVDQMEPLRIAVTATIIHSLKESFEDVARTLILVPDAEVAESYARYFEELGNHTDLRVWTAIDGPKLQDLKEKIYFGADVVIATPKRLNDLLNIEGFNSAAVQTLILDEPESLLKVGATGYTQRISDSIPPKQRIAMGTTEKGGINSYMTRFAFPFEKISFQIS